MNLKKIGEKKRTSKYLVMDLKYFRIYCCWIIFYFSFRFVLESSSSPTLVWTTCICSPVLYFTNNKMSEQLIESEDITMDASENAELLALQRIDETCVSLQEQGRYLEALECMERGLVLRQHFFGAESDEVWRACKTVGEMCNLLAMTYLQQDDFAMVLELLKKAEILTERDQAGRAVTFNNLACYYRRQGLFQNDFVSNDPLYLSISLCQS